MLPNSQHLAVLLHAKGNKEGDRSWRRKNVDIVLKVPNFRNKAKTVCQSKVAPCYSALLAAAC